MSEHVVDGIIEARTLQALIDTHTPLVSECRMHFDSEGVHVRVIDPGTVAMVLTDLSTSAFESYESGEVVVGVNLERLEDKLSVAKSGDLVRLAVDMEKLKLRLDIGNATQYLGLIDPESIRAEPDLPDLDLPNTATLEGRDLDRAVTVSGLTSDHVELHTDPDGECIEFRAQGDVDESTVDFGGEDVIECRVPESTMSLFSLDFLADIVKPMPVDSEVTLQFGDEHPMILEWEGADGYQSTTQFLAPRIQTR